ncbi:hypothetical protein ACOSP7_023250 [Xanthoceras sorbifolium]
MGRDNILLKKVENKTYRHISFSKRKNGLVKKAYEPSTVCDEDVGLLIFSPAGKLVLFDGKRSDMDNKTVDSQVEGIQDEISPRNVELEDVKKQLEVFVKCTKCIKSITSVEYYERMLEDTIKCVSLHKTLHPQTASASNVMMGSPNYDLGWPQQHDPAQFLSNNFASSTGFQLFRYFGKGTNYIKSISDAEFHERILEDPIKRIYLQKQVLEKKEFGQLQLPSQTLHPQTASASNVMMGSLNYDLEWPQQHDATQFLTNNFASSTGFQPFRYFVKGTNYINSISDAEFHERMLKDTIKRVYLLNQVLEKKEFSQLQLPAQTLHPHTSTGFQPFGNESDPFAEVFPSSMVFNGAGYSVGNAACGDYVPLQSSIAFNAAGCLYDNAVSSGSDQLAPSMEFSNTEYLAENEVSGGSHQLDYGFFYPQSIPIFQWRFCAGE